MRDDVTRLVITDLTIQRVDGNFPVAFDNRDHENYNYVAINGISAPVPPVEHEIVYPQRFMDSKGNKFEIGILDDAKESLGFILKESFALTQMIGHYARELAHVVEERNALDNKLYRIRNLNFFQRFVWLIDPIWAEERYVNN